MKRSFLVLFLIAFFAGCTSAPRVVDWRAEATAPWNYPEPYRRLYLRNVNVRDISPVGTRARTITGETYPIDRALVRSNLHEALGGLGVFSEVVTLPSDAKPTDAGLVLDVAFEEAALYHAGENDSARRAFWLWLLTGYPGLCVRDQLYAFGYDAKAQLTDAATGEVLVAWEPLASPDAEPLSLDFHERTTGFFSYVKTNFMPPSVIAVDSSEILREILPTTLRPSVRSLVELFGQIYFLPVQRVGLHPQQCAGVKLDEVRVPEEGKVAGDTLDLTLVVTLDHGVKAIRQVRVGDQTLLDMSAAPPLPANVKTTELRLANVPLTGSQPAVIELLLEGDSAPRRLLTVRSAPNGELRAERRKHD